MESYKSDKVSINCDIQTVFSKLSDPEVLKNHLEANLDKLPEEARENLGKVSFSGDSISIESPMGPLKMSMTEKVEPSKIVFAATQSPVPFGMAINLKEAGEGTTEAVAELQGRRADVWQGAGVVALRKPVTCSLRPLKRSRLLGL